MNDLKGNIFLRIITKSRGSVTDLNSISPKKLVYFLSEAQCQVQFSFSNLARPPCCNLMTFPKARSNANYISLSFTAAAAVCKSRVVIPLELPARKSGSPLCGPDATTALVCAGVTWKQLFGVMGISRKQQRGGGRKLTSQDSLRCPCSITSSFYRHNV